MRSDSSLIGDGRIEPSGICPCALEIYGKQIKKKKSPTHRAFPGVDRSLPPLLIIFYHVHQAFNPPYLPVTHKLSEGDQLAASTRLDKLGVNVER